MASGLFKPQYTKMRRGESLLKDVLEKKGFERWGKKC